MPKATARSRGASGGVQISYKGLGALLAAIPAVGALWFAFTSIATKSDVSSIKDAITPTLVQHESRIRELELQNASHFGASPTSTARPGSLDNLPLEATRLVLAQYLPVPDATTPANQSVARAQPQPLPQRRVVIPLEMIREYALQPSRGGTYALLGEDGRYFSLDDVLSIIIKMHLDEMKRRGVK